MSSIMQIQQPCISLLCTASVGPCHPIMLRISTSLLNSSPCLPEVLHVACTIDRYACMGPVCSSHVSTDDSSE